MRAASIEFSHRQEPRAERSVPDAPPRIDSRSEHEAEMIRPRRSIHPCGVHQRGETDPPSSAHDGEALGDECAIEARERGDIGDGRERDEVEGRKQVRGGPRVGPKSSLAQSARSRGQSEERHAGGAQTSLPGEESSCRFGLTMMASGRISGA